MGSHDRARGSFPDEKQGPGAAAIEPALQSYEQGLTDVAERACRHILAGEPRNAQALHLLGLIAAGRGDPGQAAVLIGSAIAVDPAVGLYHFNLGNVQRALGRPAEALASYARAVALDPDRFAAWFNLAQLHAERGAREQAIVAFRAALRIDPASAQARLGLAAALVDAAHAGDQAAVRSTEAVVLLEDDWPRAPDPLHARFVYAAALVVCERWTEAVAHLEPLVTTHPNAAGVRNQLANCYNRLGRTADAVREYRATFRAAPDFHEALTGALGTLNAVPDVTPDEVVAAHLDWAARVAAPLYPSAPRFDRVRDPNRRLRVGYVSPDLRRHPVGAMFAPVLERHDPARVETFCYYSYPSSDVMTGRMRGAAHRWRDVAGLDDAAVADLIQGDQIDILVDLAGHTKHTRLLVFARRPAPIQVSWLGYFNTTGLATMDYFVTDPVSSPPGQERCFVERLVRLPATRICYAPPEYMPAVSALPARRRGRVTFGCLNALAKLNDHVLALWGKILAAAPGAQLVLQAAALNDPLAQRDFRVRAAAHGIATERLELRRFVAVEQAAESYHDIDIALDPFPYCGGMTSLDALWMGVPVVTLAQEMLAGRQSASMLANLGLPELIAPDAPAYVSVALELARDLERLAILRAGLRERFRSSPLADNARFARDLEGAYAGMWEAWLATPQPD